MFSPVFKVLALAAVAFAIPATTKTDVTDVGNATDSPEVPDVGFLQLCTQHNPVADGRGCNPVLVTDSKCIAFQGSLSTYNKAVTGMDIPKGYICFAHRGLTCNDAANNFIILGPGFISFDTSLAHDGHGVLIPFSRQAGSIICNPIFFPATCALS